jgi:hypothetical protein
VQGTTQDASRLACSGRAWHSARIVVVAVGKAKAGRQAGKLLAWRCRADSGNVHVESMLWGWSEREKLWTGSNRRAWQRCATRHPQARRNKCPPASQPASQPAATADDSAELAEDKSQKIKHAERADRIHAEGLHGRPV